VPLIVPELVRLSINPSERPGRIVLVEPDFSRRAALLRVLEPEGYRVLAVDTTEEASRARELLEADLILYSAESTANPLDLVARLRAGAGPSQPLVILVGMAADEQTIATALYAGADDYVADITRADELRARIRVQLRNRRTLETLQRLRSERDLLRQDAQIDPLTGLMNRRSLEASVRERCESGKRFGVLFMDIDHFKSVNDRYGHQIGDRVLAALGNTLRSTLRPEDGIGRYGGEEFVALIGDAGPESARLVAERLRVQVESMPGVPGGPKQVTLSVGSTVFDPQKHHESAADLMRRADSALYAAKRAGRNRVVVLMPGAPLQKIDPAVSAMSSPPAPEIRVLSATGFGEKA
jgi:two-component system, cell cycle response regulator